MSISKNNILFEARSSPLPCRDSNDRQLREIWIGSSRSIFVYVDSNMAPPGQMMREWAMAILIVSLLTFHDVLPTKVIENT